MLKNKPLVANSDCDGGKLDEGNGQWWGSSIEFLNRGTDGGHGSGTVLLLLEVDPVPATEDLQALITFLIACSCSVDEVPCISHAIGGITTLVTTRWIVSSKIRAAGYARTVTANINGVNPWASLKISFESCKFI